MFDAGEFERMNDLTEEEYRNMEVTSRAAAKNKHRAFWNEKVFPLLEQIGPSFQRVALAGSLNNLTPKVCRQFYSLLRLIRSLPDEQAAMVMNACWISTAVGSLIQR
jgi:hypothetical protein